MAQTPRPTRKLPKPVYVKIEAVHFYGGRPLGRQYDRQLGIKTVGLREWGGHSHYNRYEATPYEALERLFQTYRFGKGDRVVDFGCGRGRVTFSIHHRFQVPVVGIEAHDKTYEEALVNKTGYRFKTKHIAAPIQLKYGLAEHYEVKPADNRFYFFNPFSHDVFRKVMGNIMKSVKEAPRTIEVILYYPLPEYKEILQGHAFQMINKVTIPDANDALEKFLIYRFAAPQDG